MRRASSRRRHGPSTSARPWRPRRTGWSWAGGGWRTAGPRWRRRSGACRWGSLPVPDLLFVPALTAYLAILAALFCYGVNFVYLTILAIRSTSKHPATVVPDEWPVVTVQLPIYNELYVAGRLIAAGAPFDYPAGRLEVQALDDSTDETSAIVAERVARWRARGVNIVHVRRSSREGVKAGAPGTGPRRARGELGAI